MENLKEFEKLLKSALVADFCQYQKELEDFIFAPSKRLRPKLVFACAKALNFEVTKEINLVAQALELLHSATLIHDDIIDNAEFRREIPTFNNKFGAKLSVLLGDYLLSLALKTLSGLNSLEIYKIFSEYILQILKGEMTQFKNIGEILTVEKYVEKSKLKTAKLFALGAVSTCVIAKAKQEKKKALEDFAINFGIAYQIKNDLEDYKNKKNDAEIGIFNLPDIYLAQNMPACDIIKICEDKIKSYKKLAKEALSGFSNIQKQNLEDFLEILKG